MSKFIIIFLILSFINYSVYANCSNKQPDKLKTYIIDLDLDPQLRFQQVAADFKDGIIELVDAQKRHVDPLALEIIEYIATDIDNYLSYPFSNEMKGISNATGLNLGDVVIGNLIYDLTAFCTSIIAQQADGKIIHGRNLDYRLQNYLTNITYIAKFQRNGKLLFTTVQTAGYVGILTGHKKNAFTFTNNERNQGHWWINLLFGILDKKAQPLAFLTRNVLENGKDFMEAIEILTKTDLIAPAYFIIGGMKPYEGAVITRNQNTAIDIWRLNATSKSIESWYLLETNYDHWLPPPPNDDRRTPGMKAMDTIGQTGINSSSILDVLTIEPVCNKRTVYSIYMSAVEDDSNIKILMRYN